MDFLNNILNTLCYMALIFFIGITGTFIIPQLVTVHGDGIIVLVYALSIMASIVFYCAHIIETWTNNEE